ncbi:OmpA family protein [Bradyrhizobium sp. BRP22]|nr:OmpA family protein [Bradyrhizobium sp. BRP22]MCA1454905.1 OmpA family protein [Bradyrhizobium sp. BRP22]
MTNLRLVLLATTALTVTQLISSASHAQTAPLVVAQAEKKEEGGPEGRPKQPPKAAPPAAAPKQPGPPQHPGAAPPAHPPAPPAAAPARPAPPPAAAPARPTPPPPAAPERPTPPAAAPARPTAPPPAATPARPTPPPAAAPHAPTPPTAAPPAHTPPPAAAPPARPAPPTAAPPARTQSPAAPSAATPPAAPAAPATPTPPPGARKEAPPAGARQPAAAPTAAPTQRAPGAAPTPTTPSAAGTPTPTTPPARPGAATATPPAAGAPASPPPAAGTPSAAPAAPQARPGVAPGAAATPSAAPAAPTAVPGTPAAAPPPGQAQSAPPTVAPAFRRAPQVTAPLPPPPADFGTKFSREGVAIGPRRIEDFRAERREIQEGGRTVITEPGRMIIRDPSGQAYVRHSEIDRFRYGARDVQTQMVGGDTRTVVVRPDGSQIVTVVGRDGQLLRRIRRDPRGREMVIIDNSYRDPGAVGGFYVDMPPPVVRIPYNRYIVDAEEASPDVIYETMVAPPVDRIERRYSLDEIRYSPNVRMLMPSIDVNTINFDTGSWEISQDQAAKLQVIADGLNRALQRNPQEVFLIEGHTDAVGNEVDNLSLSDRRAESTAELLTQQFQVPAENLTSQGYGEQNLKEQTDGPSRINRRVTIRRITPLLNGGTASLPAAAAPR